MPVDMKAAASAEGCGDIEAAAEEIMMRMIMVTYARLVKVKTRPGQTRPQIKDQGQQSDVSHKKSTRRERGVRRLSSTSFFDDKDERAFSIGLTRGRG